MYREVMSVAKVINILLWNFYDKSQNSTQCHCVDFISMFMPSVFINICCTVLLVFRKNEYLCKTGFKSALNFIVKTRNVLVR